MNTFKSCGLVWYPPPADGKCPCAPDQTIRLLYKSEKEGRMSYSPIFDCACAWLWGSDKHAGWFPVNPDGTEITSKPSPRPRVLRRRFPLARGARPTWK